MSNTIVKAVCQHCQRVTIVPSEAIKAAAADEITALRRRVAELEAALNRQGDNMAFIVNYVSIPDSWYEKFRRELEEDRAALTPSNKKDPLP